MPVSMLISWQAMKLFAPRYTVIAALLVGLVLCVLSGEFTPASAPVTVVLPTFTAPEFNWPDMLGIDISFFLVTLASQNAPGLTTLKASGYEIVPRSGMRR